EYMRCIGAEAFIKDIFLDSDTDMMVLSFIPSRREAEPLTIAEAAATREIVERMEGTHRLLIHGRVNPNQDGDLDDMDELAERWGVAAWKCYTQWGPDGVGFHMTDPDTGIPFVEKARRLGIKTICIHKGIPFGRRSYQHSVCTDIGAIAARYPDVNFLVYHAGYVPGQKEGPYRPGRGEGVDELIRSVLDNGLGRGSNVYAELGTTWRMLMRDPQEAAHCVGKLVKHLGADNVLYGSDCVWYGSPQDQIQAFRSFQITAEFQERFGYPAMTPVLRAKILGLNGARVYGIQVDEILERAGRDTIAASRENYRNDPHPHFRTFGPTTRREFIDLLRLKGGSRA
ncbi:MAG: amidohydrolase family protein, partial [Gammaproteobacteria bacterium]|nr:amidohydrolase family protein [Gammaproteobacteria bacterium]